MQLSKQDNIYNIRSDEIGSCWRAIETWHGPMGLHTDGVFDEVGRLRPSRRLMISSILCMVRIADKRPFEGANVSWTPAFGQIYVAVAIDEGGRGPWSGTPSLSDNAPIRSSVVDGRSTPRRRGAEHHFTSWYLCRPVSSGPRHSSGSHRFVRRFGSTALAERRQEVHHFNDHLQTSTLSSRALVMACYVTTHQKWSFIIIIIIIISGANTAVGRECVSLCVYVCVRTIIFERDDLDLDIWTRLTASDKQNGSVHFWINVWMAGKPVWSPLTRAILSAVELSSF